MNGKNFATRVLPLLQKVHGILEVKGDLVPLCSSLGKIEDHFFLNFIWAEKEIGNPELVLRGIREASQEAFEIISNSGCELPFSSIVVSFFSAQSDGENIRLYRTRVFKKDYQHLAKGSFRSFCSGEESNHSAIEELIFKKMPECPGV